MNRKDTTEFLSNLLETKLNSERKHWAKEVSLDYGTKDVRRVDYMTFEPKGVTCISDIEKGIFTCYEIKSCREDVFSGNGLNFVGEKNYIVTTMECYKQIQKDIRNGDLDVHIKKCFPKAAYHFGVIVPIPYMSDPIDEYENPTELNEDIHWNLKTVYACREGRRERSTTELLYCMLRSGR